MKPLKQRRLEDFFPLGVNRGQSVIRPTSGFATRPEIAEHNGKSSLVVERIPTKWRTIISLEMQGHTQKDIAALVGMSVGGVCGVVNDPRYVEYREVMLGEIDREFFAMKPLAFKALRDGFTNPDTNVALRAAEMWFRGASFGGYAKDPPKTDNVSAEDVAKQLLKITADNVQINIGTRESDASGRLVAGGRSNGYAITDPVHTSSAEPSTSEGDC